MRDNSEFTSATPAPGRRTCATTLLALLLILPLLMGLSACGSSGSSTPVPPVTTACVSINAVQGTAITPVTLVGSGGTGGPYAFLAAGLPGGLSISASGTISGTPTASGTFNYIVTVVDAAGHTGTASCTITVAPGVSAACVSITAVQGTAITPVTMTGSGGAGGPYTFTATGLPAGLSISTSGTISGTPTVNGTFSYTVTVTDSPGTPARRTARSRWLRPLSPRAVRPTSGPMRCWRI